MALPRSSGRSSDRRTAWVHGSSIAAFRRASRCAHSPATAGTASGPTRRANRSTTRRWAASTTRRKSGSRVSARAADPPGDRVRLQPAATPMTRSAWCPARAGEPGDPGRGAEVGLCEPRRRGSIPALDRRRGHGSGNRRRPERLGRGRPAAAGLPHVHNVAPVPEPAGERDLGPGPADCRDTARERPGRGRAPWGPSGCSIGLAHHRAGTMDGMCGADVVGGCPARHPPGARRMEKHMRNLKSSRSS